MNFNDNDNDNENSFINNNNKKDRILPTPTTPSTLSYSRYSIGGDGSMKPKKSSLKTPSRASIQPNQYSDYLTQTPATATTSKLLSTTDLVTPIKGSANLPTFLNDPSLTPMPTPSIKNRVIMSEIKPTVHTYPSSPAKPNKPKGGVLYNISKFLNRSNNYTGDITLLNDTTINENDDSDSDSNEEDIKEKKKDKDNYNDQTMQDIQSNSGGNKSFLSSTSSGKRSFYNRNKNNNDDDNDVTNDIGSPATSDYYHSPSSASNGSKSKPIIKKKPLFKRIQDIIRYPIDKFDEMEETLVTFPDGIYYKPIVYLVVLVLNLLLFGYAIDLFGNLIGFILLSISLVNSILYFKSSKKSILYRFEGTKFTSPNMSLTQIQAPNGTVDNVVVLNSWDPKFPSKILFTFFSPLHCIIMGALSTPEFDKFITYSCISLVVSFLLYFFSDKYDQKIKDEKILFTQVANEYNYHMRAIPIKRDKGTQTTIMNSISTQYNNNNNFNNNHFNNNNNNYNNNFNNNNLNNRNNFYNNY